MSPWISERPPKGACFRFDRPLLVTLGPSVDGRSSRDGQKGQRTLQLQKQLPRSFLLSVASVSFNLLTPLVVFLAFFSFGGFASCVGSGKWAAGASVGPPLRCSDEYSDRDFFKITIVACVRSLLLGIAPPRWPLAGTAAAEPPHDSQQPQELNVPTRGRQRKENKHSSSGSLFFVEKLVVEPGQVNIVRVDFIFVCICVSIVTRQWQSKQICVFFFLLNRHSDSKPQM